MPPRRTSGATTAKALALNLGILAVLGGVHTGRAALAAAGACLAGAVVQAHAVALTTRIDRAPAARLGHMVWFYLAASAALLAGMGLGLLLAGGAAADTADAYRVLRLAHVHLNMLGWVGLAVVGTQVNLWPTVLRTRMVAGWSGRSAGRSRRWSSVSPRSPPGCWPGRTWP